MDLVLLPHRISVGGEHIGLRLQISPSSIDNSGDFTRIDVELLSLHCHFRVHSEGYSISKELHAFAHDSTRTSLEYQGLGSVTLGFSRIEPGMVQVELDYVSTDETFSVQVEMFDRWEFEEWHGN